MGLVRWAWDLLFTVPRDRRWLYILIPVNLLGSLYGFNWYRGQLAETPLRYWPVVPDSPLSCLLFSLVLILIYARRRFRPLEGIAYISMIKYGFWTMFVFAQAWIARKAAFPEEMFLFATHFGMAVEAVLFSRYYSPGRSAILACGLWSVFNDYMDYWKGFHPALPMMEFYGSVRAVSLAGTYAVILGLLLWARDQAGDVTG